MKVSILYLHRHLLTTHSLQGWEDRGLGSEGKHSRLRPRGTLQLEEQALGPLLCTPFLSELFAPPEFHSPIKHG